MKPTRSMLPLVVGCLVTGGVLLAQEKRSETMPPGKNPHQGNQESIRSGQALYRIRCADCHGLDAAGYRGPDLKALIAGDVADERLFQTIRKGVPGTEMPAAPNAPDDDILMVIAYLRSVGAVSAAESPSGNIENGAKLFSSQCASCHRVAGKGGRIG